MAFVSSLVLIRVLTFLALMPDDGVHVTGLCSSPYCPPPWHAFQAHCYLLVDKPMSWMDAERFCQMLSHPGRMAHLASIHGQDEDEFIKEYVWNASGPSTTPQYWIGYNDIQQEHQFHWSDGSDVTYEAWLSGEPNNQVDEDCVERRFSFDSKWNDQPCSESIHFVCKH